MKKNITYKAIFILIGVLIGYLFFSGNDNTKKDNLPSETTSEQKQEKSKPTTWTCSMHPNILKNKFGQCPICGMDLIPREIDDNTTTVFKMTETAMKLADIVTYKVRYRNDVSKELKVNGRILLNETKISSVVTHFPGRVEKLYVNYTGEFVRKGQRIASLYSPELIVAQKELLEAKKFKQHNPELMQSSINKLMFWKVPDNVIEKLLNSNKIQEHFDIYSSYTGVVRQLNVSVGDHLKEGGELFILDDIKHLWATFDIYENDLVKLDVGDSISFTTPALPSREFETSISFLEPTVSKKKRVIRVRSEIDNPYSYLRPEMFIYGTLKTKSKEELLVIPKSAVLWTGKRSVVYVKLPYSETPSFEYREIILGDEMGDYYEIYEGIYEEEEVVINGSFMLDASAQLSNKRSMMNY